MSDEEVPRSTARPTQLRLLAKRFLVKNPGHWLAGYIEVIADLNEGTFKDLSKPSFKRELCKKLGVTPGLIDECRRAIYKEEILRRKAS